MAVYTPEPRLTNVEKKILALIASALIETPEGASAANLRSECVPLSDKAAQELLVLLEQFIASRRFRERAEFVEMMGGSSSSLDRAREIYLRGRKEAGRTRVASSWHWAAFLRRLGKRVGWAPPMYSGPPMTFTHFLRMEERLLVELRIHPRVRALIIQLVLDRKATVEAMRRGGDCLEPGQALNVPMAVLTELKQSNVAGEGVSLALGRSVALATLITDVSVMFTTRDWGVAGTLSAMAATVPPLVRRQP